MSVVMAPEFHELSVHAQHYQFVNFVVTQRNIHSRPVSGVGCGESSSSVPMEYTIKCQYTCDHYVNVRDTQTDRHCYYH